MKFKVTDVSKETYLREAEVRPNRAFANSLIGVIVALLVLFVLVETNTIQSVSKVNMRIAYVPWLLFFGLAQVDTHVEELVRNRFSKYFLVVGTLVLTLLTASMINVFAALLIVVPLALSGFYSSKTITYITVVGSVLVSTISPVISLT